MRRPVLFAAAAVSLAAVNAGCGAIDGSRSGNGSAGDDLSEVAGEAVVERVVDGDTVVARTADGRRERVRLIGIDAPERTTSRTGAAECGGEQAKAAAEAAARRWPRVVLRTDPTQGRVDRYGRLLAYVVPQAEPEASYQQALLAAGWAKVYVYAGHPFSRVDEFRRAATQARDARVGVWAACGGDFRRPLP